jgi:hypothetical protein
VGRLACTIGLMAWNVDFCSENGSVLFGELIANKVCFFWYVGESVAKKVCFVWYVGESVAKKVCFV